MFSVLIVSEIFLYFSTISFLIPSLRVKKRRSIVSNFQEQQFIAVYRYTDKKSIDPCPSIFALSFIDSSLNSIGAVDTTNAFVVYVVYCQTFPPKHVPCMQRRYPEAIRVLLSYGKLVFRLDCWENYGETVSK